MTQTDDYATLAADYAANRMQYSSKLYEHLDELGFAAGSNLLDIACGTGLAAAPFVERGMRITGIDVSKAMLAIAREKIPDGTFVEGRAEKLPFRTHEFDLTICAQAIHRLDQAAALKEMMRVTKPGGRIAIWWRKLIVDEPMRLVQREACTAAGVPEPKEIMPGSFLAFYALKFAERWLRVVPQMITTDANRWVGFERARASLATTFGDRAEAYFAELEKLLVEKSEGRPFQVRLTHYLYVGKPG